MCGGIRSSGCGCIGDGRRGLQGEERDVLMSAKLLSAAEVAERVGVGTAGGALVWRVSGMEGAGADGGVCGG